ncbi:MAG: hypothetical protein B6I31_00140, partial [Desulfobacteraceae bacterium 4572_19]
MFALLPQQKQITAKQQIAVISASDSRSALDTELITESITFAQSYSGRWGKSASLMNTGKGVVLCPDLRFGAYSYSPPYYQVEHGNQVPCYQQIRSSTDVNEVYNIFYRGFISSPIILPTNILTIEKVKLQLYIYQWYDTQGVPSQGQEFALYPLIEPWDMNSLQDVVNENKWQNLPAYNTAFSVSQTVFPQVGWYEWDVTDIITAQQQGLLPNYGFMMAGSPYPDRIGWRVDAHRWDVITQSLTPRLVLTYLRPSSPTATFSHNAPHEWQQTTYFTFTGSTGDDLPANITYNWNFGDVNSQGGENLKYVTNMYNVPGQYTATL